MKQFTLTKEEFITRSMAGEVFISVDSNSRYHYDSTQVIPFRVGIDPLEQAWERLNGNYLFTLEEPKPRIERRWKYRVDLDGTTKETNKYFSDKAAKYAFESAKEWYKVEDCFIDVEIKA